jgi:hypothetical protein
MRNFLTKKKTLREDDIDTDNDEVDGDDFSKLNFNFFVNLDSKINQRMNVCASKSNLTLFKRSLILMNI